MARLVFSHVIQGRLKGKKIPIPNRNSIKERVTTQKIKESIFHIIKNYFSDLKKVIFCDVFAGSGQVGIEAISRGVRHTFFCEADKQRSTNIGRWLKGNCPDPCFSIFDNHKDQIFRNTSHLDLKNIFITESNPNDFSFIYFMDPPYRLLAEKKFLEKIFCFIRNTILKAQKESSCKSLLFILQTPHRKKIKNGLFDQKYEYSNNHLWIKFLLIV